MPEPSYILRKHQDDVTCVKFLDTHNDKIDILASGDVTGEVKIWSLETRRPIHEFRPTKPQCSIPNIEYHHNNNTFITQTRSPSHGWIHGWDINKLLSNNTKNIEKNTPIFKFDTQCSSFCRFNIVTHLKQQLLLNDHNKPHEKQEEAKQIDDDSANQSLLSKMLHKHNTKISQNDHNADLDIDDDEHIISSNIDTSHLLIACTGFQRGLLQIWDCHNSTIVNQLDFDDIPKDDKKRGMIMSVDAFYTNKRNGMLCVVVSESGIIDVFDVRASKILFSKKFGQNEPLTCMALNNKKTRGICAGANNMLYGFAIKYNSNQIKMKKELELKNDGANVVQIRKYDEKIFGFGGWDHRTRIYNWNTFKPLCILKGHKGGITDLAFHPHQNILATSSKDAHIALYELY